MVQELYKHNHNPSQKLSYRKETPCNHCWSYSPVIVSLFRIFSGPRSSPIEMQSTKTKKPISQLLREGKKPSFFHQDGNLSLVRKLRESCLLISHVLWDNIYKIILQVEIKLRNPMCLVYHVQLILVSISLTIEKRKAVTEEVFFFFLLR